MTQVALPLPNHDGSPFDAIRHVDPDGSEWWSARELMPLLGYTKWERFTDVIERAIASAQAVGHDVEQAFSRRRENLGTKPRIDYRLSRYAAYLIAMNGDARKSEIATAQMYFAVRTREAETTARDTNPRHQIPKTFADALQLAADQAREIELQAAQVAELTPRAAQADQHRAADGLVAIGDFANKVKAWARREHGVTVRHQEVWNFLGQLGLIIRGHTVRHNHPTAFAVERDFVRLKEGEYETNTRGVQASASPRLTPAGEGWAWDRVVRRIAGHGSLEPPKSMERAAR